MGQMADACRNPVMLPGGQNKGDGADIRYEIAESLHLFFRYLRRRGQQIVGILQKKGMGIGKADALAARHGVSADEVRGQSRFFHTPEGRGFDTAYIR